MILGAHLMQQAVGQRHGLVLPPQRVSLSMADADIVHYGVPRKIDSPWESASGGVARRERDARLAAIGEAVERTTSGLVQLPMRPRRDIPPGERIDAEDFALFTPDQRARPGFPHGSIHDPECPYVEVFSLFDNSPVWVPQPFVSLQDPHRTGVPNSSGLAAGPDAHAALLRGVQELIERDALMTTWLHGLSGRAVAPPDPLASEVARLSGEFTVLDLTPAYSPFPVAAVMGGIPKRGVWRYSLGVACKHDWESAVEKAHLEWNQGVLFAGIYGELTDVSRIRKNSELHSFDEHAMYYTLYPELWPDLPILREKNVLRSPSQQAAPEEPRRALEVARKALLDAGIRVYYREVSTIDAIQAGVRVVKALSPDMALIHSHDAWPFLHKVDGMVESRYPGRGAESRFPNLKPHPLG